MEETYKLGVQPDYIKNGKTSILNDYEKIKYIVFFNRKFSISNSNGV
jgi:hypothetical protein